MSIDNRSKLFPTSDTETDTDELPENELENGDSVPENDTPPANDEPETTEDDDGADDGQGQDDEGDEGEPDDNGQGQGDEPKPGDEGYREKFRQSSSEVNRLLGENETLKNQLHEATHFIPPTQAELEAAFPNWEYLTDHEKQMARLTLENRKVTVALRAQAADNETERSLERNVSQALRKYPILRDHEEAFRAYIMKPANFRESATGSKVLTVSIETLAESYLFRNGLVEAPGSPKPKAPRKPTLERGGAAGGTSPAKGPAISDAQAEEIRKKDPKRYARLLKEGKLK